MIDDIILIKYLYFAIATCLVEGRPNYVHTRDHKRKSVRVTNERVCVHLPRSAYPLRKFKTEIWKKNTLLYIIPLGPMTWPSRGLRMTQA